MIDETAVREQSKAAYGQHKEIWRKHASQHSQKAPFKNMADFMNVGVGKACLLVANGFSFEENIEDIKQAGPDVDILCCDKTLGHLLDNGITPTYVLVCDAKVNYEKYMEPWKDQLQDTILFMNVCANPKWSFNGNWKDQYFFVNHDVIQSEREFCHLSQCPNTIPAATNVSNAMVVFITQSDNTGRKNFFGYDKILLIGFDYSWRFGKSYYAFDETGNGKSQYMRHTYCTTLSGSPAYTSGNLLFSAQWLDKYIGSFQLPVVQCTKESILSARHHSPLKSQLSYSYRPEDGVEVRKILRRRDELAAELHKIEKRVTKIGADHYFHYLKTVS